VGLARIGEVPLVVLPFGFYSRDEETGPVVLYQSRGRGTDAEVGLQHIQTRDRPALCLFIEMQTALRDAPRQDGSRDMNQGVVTKGSNWYPTRGWRRGGRGKGRRHENFILIEVLVEKISNRRSGEDLSDLKFPHLEEVVLVGCGVALIIGAQQVDRLIKRGVRSLAAVCDRNPMREVVRGRRGKRETTNSDTR
jgi:hypothetical protein